MNKHRFAVLIWTFLIFQSCVNYDCDTETQEIKNMKYNMIIDKKYVKNHRGYIEGQDSLGNTHIFVYHGFLFLDELATKGDRFIKKSESMNFTLWKEELIYEFKWDCISTGLLISVDTIKILSKN